MQVVGHVLPLDDVADEHDLAIAQLLGDVEGAHRGDQHHGDAGDHPGQAQGPDHPPQHPKTVAPQVPGGLDEALVHLGHDGVEGENHVGDVVVDHADDDGGLRADDVDVGQVEQGEEVVEDARVLQNGHPGVGADEEVHPHRNHDDGEEHLLGAGLGPGHDVGQGIGQHQADGGGDDGQFQGPPEDEQIRPYLLGGAILLDDVGGGHEEPLDVLQGEGKVVVGKRVVGHKDQGDQDEEHRPHRVRGQGEVVGPEDPALLLGEGFVHVSSSSGASDSSSSSLEKEE